LRRSPCLEPPTPFLLTAVSPAARARAGPCLRALKRFAAMPAPELRTRVQLLSRPLLSREGGGGSQLRGGGGGGGLGRSTGSRTLPLAGVLFPSLSDVESGCQGPEPGQCAAGLTRWLAGAPGIMAEKTFQLVSHRWEQLNAVCGPEQRESRLGESPAQLALITKPWWPWRCRRCDRGAGERRGSRWSPRHPTTRQLAGGQCP